MYLKKIVLSSFLVFVAILLMSGCGGSSAKPSVSVTPATSTVDATNTVALSATVANDKNSAGVSWTVSGGGALSKSTTSGATYTAPAASNAALSVTVTATSVADTTKTATATITVPAAPAVTTGALVAGTVGTAYSGAVAASGGIPPYTWTITSGTLPAGLTMNSAGAISGTPTAAGAGTTNLTFKVTDAGTPNALSATTTLGLTVASAPAMTFTTTTLAAGTYKSAYAASVAATGGAGTLTYSLVSGALPTGLSMSAAGAISGTPTVVGSYPFKVQATDAFGDTATQALSLTVSYPALAITPLTLPTGYVGSAYASTTLAATGGSGAGFTWSVASGSAMPAGLSLSAAGVLTGTPTAAGTTSVTMSVTDSASNTASLPLSIVVKAAVSITTGVTLPVGYVGSVYSLTLTATGGSGSGYGWTVTSGSTLPAGLSLSGAGVLSGTPTAAGTPSFSLTVTDSASNTASSTFSMTISPGVSITTPTALPGGYQGTAYPSTTLAAIGGSGTPYTWKWSAASGSSLPAGLSLSTAGLITGTPTGSGSFSIAVTATDSASNKGLATFTLTIEAALAVSTTTLQSGTVNVAYSQALAATGGSGTGYTWTTTGPSTLPTLNLSLSAAGTLSGTPTTTGTATFTAQVTDSQSHTATANLSVSVYNALTITTTSLPAASVGSAYSQTLNAGGGSGSGYTWTATSSNLAAYGLSLSTSGVVSGTPTVSGPVNFTANVTDSGHNTAFQALSFLVYGALSLQQPSPTVPGPATLGSPYDSTISLNGGSGNFTWTVTGLPADGLSNLLSGPTQHIVGTPTTATTVTFTLQVLDTVTHLTVGPYTYSIVVSSPPPLVLPAPNPTSLPSATINTAYSGAIDATGGASPYTWTVNNVTVPTNGTTIPISNGLTASSTGGNTLTVAGTPTSAGTVNVAASIKDNLGTVVGPNPYTVLVNAAGSQVSGQVFLNSNCGGGGNQVPFTVTINTTPPQSTQTDGSGNYSFPSIPNGTYTITPSIPGASSSLFSPLNYSGVVVNNTAVSGKNFNATVGYTVSGNVTYSPSATAQTGQTYISVTGGCLTGNGGPGTSISEATLTSGGAYTIRGVPPGSYTLQAWMDSIGQSVLNAIDPTGSASLTVSTANVTNAAITIHDPTFTTPALNPTIQGIIPNAQGVLIEFSPSKNSNNVEDANQYVVEWSTSPTLGGGTGGAQFATIAGSHTFAGGGDNGVWILNNATLSGSGFSFISGTTYYFQARSFNTLDTANPHPAGWCNYTATGCSGTTGFTGVTISTPACSGTCTTVSGSVTIPASITIKPGAPLYLGMLQFSSNSGGNPTGIYVTEIASPANGANNFAVTVPSGSNYAVLGILDQNNTGGFGPGAITNVRDHFQANLTISGSTQNVAGITLPTANSTATVSTQFSSDSCQGCGSATTSYQLSFNVGETNKLPVAVFLNSGPNVPNNGGTVALDMSLCSDCGNAQFQFSLPLLGTPKVGDAYGFTVTYSDGTQENGSMVTGAVTGWNGGNALVGASNAPSALAPIGTSSTSTTPTFTWTDPSTSTGANLFYNFYIYNQTVGCSGGNCNIWQIPGNNSKSNGFSSSTTSITWGTDPTGGGSTPSVGSLTSGDVYNWAIQVMDINGNSAQTSVWYQP